MSSLPNEIFSDITNLLPNDDITDLMLLSRKFNALVTPRLKKIDEEMATVNQSIESFMPSPEPSPTDNEWISQLNLKRFEPIGSEAKSRMKELFEKEDFMNSMRKKEDRNVFILRFREAMSLERFDVTSFLRILGALVLAPKFRQEYNVPGHAVEFIHYVCKFHLATFYKETIHDLDRIWLFYK
ncbi:hypothetical protein Ddc_16553 [Ditylenchus destructor]|nr:hypothetical protein Ddc_16553 [Ditylenchus destructor]